MTVSVAVAVQWLVCAVPGPGLDCGLCLAVAVVVINLIYLPVDVVVIIT